MESPNKNKRCPLLGLAALLLLFITMAPVAAQEVSLNDLFAPQGVSVRLNNETGSVDWDLVTGTSRYAISYTGCRMPRVVVQAIGVHHFQIPGYDAALRYDVGVRAYGEVDGEETLLGYGTDSNDRYCTSAPEPVDPVNPINPPDPVDPVNPSNPPDPVNTGNPPGGTTLNDLFAPQGVSVRLNNETGHVEWNPVTSAARYDISYTRCESPRQTLQVYGLHLFDIPGYESSVRYDVRIDVYDGQQTLLGYGTASNQRYCGNTSGNTPSQQQRSVQTRSSQLVQKNMIVSPHAGSSLVVFVDAGQIHAQDNIRGSSLSAPGSCSPGQSLAANDSLMISCTSDGHFIVLQVHPQHPGDGRRDILVFNAALTNCYRAYEYLETGAIEAFYRKC